MAGVKGKSGVYKRSAEHLNNMSKIRVGNNNVNWKNGIWAKNKQEYFKEYWKKYKIKNIDKVKANNTKMRAIRKKVYGSFSGNEWKELKNKYGNKCLCCGEKVKLTPDHIIPISKGGNNNINNIQPLCLLCNKKKYTKIINFIED